MDFMAAVAGATVVLLAAYLVVAFLKPEIFP